MPGFLDFLSDPRFLNGIASTLQASGQLATGLAQQQHGADVQAAAEFQAQQLRQNANDAMASAQRVAWNEDRRTQYVASATLAAAAASGGGASDPTVINLIAEQATEGSYRRSVALYEGDSRARLLQLQADAREFEGKSARRSGALGLGGAVIGAGSTLLKGMAKDSSLLQRFGGDGPRVSGDAMAINGLDD